MTASGPPHQATAHQPTQPLSHEKQKATGKLSLRSLLIVPFVLQIFAAVGLTGYISLRNGQRAVNDLAKKLHNEIASRTQQHLETYLATPHLVNQMSVDAVREGRLDTKKPASERYLLQQKQYFDSVSWIMFGDQKDGSFLSIGRRGKNNDLQYIVVNQSTNFLNHYYNIDARGDRIEPPEIGKQYDARIRPWYKAAVAAKQPVWSEIFPDFGSPVLVITASQSVYNRAGQLLGVAGVFLRLQDINEFLKQLKIGQSGKVFIIERDGKIVANSTPELPFKSQEAGKQTERLLAGQSSNVVVRATAEHVIGHFGNLDQIAAPARLDFQLNGQQQLVQVTPFSDGRGIDWLIVIVVPESDFMAQINANTRTTILLCLGALAVTTALGLLTSRWITQPILQLQEASLAISSGHLDRTVEVQGIDELEGLGRSFNQMAAQLKTSFIELETRVEERTAELKEAKLIADSANQAKSEFLANMSHELRTPLNGILGYAQILNRSSALPAKERHGVEIIHQCGSHLLTLINDVLDLSKIEARKLELAPSSIHFPSFLQGVAEICRIRAHQKNIDFVYDPDPQLPEGIFADEKRLRQVLLNLLGNAIKFIEFGSVTLKVAVVENHANLSTRTFKFQVEDTGVGIAPDELDKIFQAFEQVGDRQRQAEGTGLGLAISQRIVQLMNGQIQVKSQPQVGSDFFFEVELAIATDWAKQNSIATGKQIIGYQGQRRCILVVDDRWENRSVLVNLLEPLGFQLIEAENGQQGLEKIRQLSPDLVITDLAMPVMDGFELLKQIRSSNDLQHQKIIVSSASVAQADRQMSLDAGGNDFLAKPVEVSELFNLLATHLQLKWKYEMTNNDSVPSTPTTGLENPEGIILPDTVELKTLLELAQQGNLKRLREYTEHIVDSNPRYVGFAEKILQLAKQFKAEEIEELLKQHLAEEKADV